MSKYSKQDEKIVKELLNNMYDHHQKLHGGSAFTKFLQDFAHGAMVPLKTMGGLINLVAPGVGTAIAAGADVVDKMVPGARYATIGDAFSGKKVAGSGKRGRPKKKQGSGLIDILGEAYILNKAKKQKEGKEQIERYRAYNAKKAADAALVAPAPVVGSGKRGRPKGSKNKKI